MDKKEFLSLSQNERRKVADKIKQTLLADKEVVFAYIFGSFISSPSFRDVDVGIYLKNISKEEIFEKEVEMSKKIADACGLPIDFIDAKIINFAPSHFLNNIFKSGMILFARDGEFLSEMIERTSLDSVAGEYFAAQSLRELIPR